MTVTTTKQTKTGFNSLLSLCIIFRSTYLMVACIDGGLFLTGLVLSANTIDFGFRDHWQRRSSAGIAARMHL
jgi:hypothetical protein